MTSPDEVGSVGEEALRLLRALGGAAADGEAGADHQCPHGWCPACGALEYVREHPEIVTSLTDSAAGFLRSLREAFDTTTPTAEDAS